MSAYFLKHHLLFNNVSAPIRSLHRIYDEVNDAMIYAESFFKILEADDVGTAFLA